MSNFKNLSKHFWTRSAIVLTSAFLMSDCKKIGKQFDCYFYSDVGEASAPMSLFLDNELRGELPNLHTRMASDNDTILTQALHLKLRSGKYKLVGKDKHGNIKTEGTIKFSKNSGGGSSTIGGSGSAGSGETVVVKLFF